MAPLLLSINSSPQMLSSSQKEEEIVEVDSKWQSPTSSNKSAAKSPMMPRRSDPSLDEELLAMGAESVKSHSLSPQPTSKKPKAKSLVDLNLEMCHTSFSNLVEVGISPPPKMPHRRVSTCTVDAEEGNLPVRSEGQRPQNHTTSEGATVEEFYMDLNDKESAEKKKIRRFRRGVQRAFSDSEMSEASTICSRDERKKKKKEGRKKNLLQRRKERLAAEFLGKSASHDEADLSGHLNEEDDDVNDTDKDLEGFTGIALKKSAHSTHSTTLTHSSHHTHGTTTDGESVGMKKSQSEIELEVRSRVSKSPARFPRGSGQSRSRGRARSTSRHGSSVAGDDEAGTKKKNKKKRSSVSRTKRLSNRKKASSDESESSDEEYDKPRASSKSRGSKSPRRRKKSKGARRVPKKGGRRPIQEPPSANDNSMSQRTWTGAVIEANAAELVSPTLTGSGRRSIPDFLSPTDRSRDTKVSAITMSTGMFSPSSDDFSGHSALDSSLRGPQHMPGFQQIPDLEASQRAARAAGEQQPNSLLVTGNLSAVFETSSRTELGASGRDSEKLGASGRDSEEPGLSLAATPRSSLKMPTVPRRRPSTDHSITSYVPQGPLFDASFRSDTERTDDLESEELFDRFAAMSKQRSSSDLMNLVEAQQEQESRPTGLLRKSSSERNISSALKSGAARVWRRGKKKPKEVS